uniref:Uncharacterized protein n=1 Tax=Plectus sambesii TaxID=2011161 RepID=A0A914WFI5_9BILA
MARGSFEYQSCGRGRVVCARVRCAADSSDGGAGSGGAAVAGERRAGLFVVQLGRLSADCLSLITTTAYRCEPSTNYLTAV